MRDTHENDLMVWQKINDLSTQAVSLLILLFCLFYRDQIICDIFVGVGVGRDIPDYLLCPHSNNSSHLLTLSNLG